ncbi:hypothetical protein C8A05DRAFT_32957 [Staphylotrichum tortipilum]|uniref:Uncharacterized protein n=1 Tax=Staphylotrichum tortipilum TaxID=2831512 RepID=A0AAN6RTX4_9PEZI|nr:hypothetical protein C8A05DRAFT_32957 [Staphylotrichum longicolle]
MAASPLSALPAELVEAIVEQLCLSCVPDPAGTPACFTWTCSFPSPYNTDRARAAALAGLCLTSRRLSAPATRHLYHRPLCAPWPLLARTLLARPDLAALVCDLPLADAYRLSPTDFCPREVAEYYSAALQNRTLSSAIALPPPPGYDDDDDDPDSSETNLFTAHPNAPADLLTHLCPSLSTLHLTLHYPPAFRLPLPFPSPLLHTLTICHADTHFGLTLLAAQPLLLTCATTLRNLTLHRARRVPDLSPLTLPALASLTLRCSTISHTSFTDLLTLSPNLKRFHYEMGGPVVGDAQFTLAQAHTALEGHAPQTLEGVQFEAGENEQWAVEWGNRTELESPKLKLNQDMTINTTIHATDQITANINHGGYSK